MDILTHKCCRRCKKVKPISEYGKNPTSLDGYFHVCKLCVHYRRIPDNEYFENVTKGLNYCFRCKQWKILDEFVKNSRSIIGVGSVCIECHRIEANDYARRNRKKIIHTGNEWRKNNRERHLENRRRWLSIPENAEKQRERNREWSKSNLDKIKVLIHKRRARILGSGGSYTVDEWKSLCEKYDYRCLRCGKKKPLTADHVIPVFLGGSSFINNIQPLCKSCNSSKSTKTIDYRESFGVSGV